MLNALSYYVNNHKNDTNNIFLWVFVGNDPAKKSFSIIDCKYIEDSILRKSTYFSKYKGLNIVINTGYDNFNQPDKEYPERLRKFTKRNNGYIDNHFFYTYEYDMKTGNDTIYHSLKYYKYWVSPIKLIPPIVVLDTL